MLKLNEEKLIEQNAIITSDLHTAFVQLPSAIADIGDLLEIMRSFEYSITDHLIGELRKKYQVKL